MCLTVKGEGVTRLTGTPECVEAPPRIPPRASPMGILRRQFRQFQLSSLAAELTQFLEQLSRPSVPENPFLPPRIVQSTSTRDMGTQTSPDLNSRREGSCLPDMTTVFSLSFTLVSH
ncbi:hypothetical protein C0J50_15185 [Silurus asotus]|uniref:Uncharacterized protein n=1 Tax=Silurus asotus TaxID=30991 RepID=A0AAD5AZM3_SILAS|nr:hypothetical protein C0J50_15185 [Silurus asotus]